MAIERWMQDYFDAWNSRNGERLAAYMAKDVVYEDIGLGQVFRGRESIVRAVAETERFSADYVFSLLRGFQLGSDYTWEWEMRGTNTGDAAGIPATGKQYAVRGASVGRLNDQGQIAEHRDYWNMADYLMQVGLLTPPSQPWIE